MLIEAIRQTGDLVMPPEPEEKLADDQIAILEDWVAAGAYWPDSKLPAEDEKAKLHASHWAFQPVQEVAPPQVSNPEWCKTPVDQFVLAKLNETGFTPSPAADRRTLIRRATYDVTGLPPTPEEVLAFESDPDPNAY